MDDSGDLFILDGCVVRKVSPNGIITTFSDAEFHDPQGIAVDRSGNVYVADSNNSKVNRVGAPEQYRPNASHTTV